jgi:hypothetical protein
VVVGALRTRHRSRHAVVPKLALILGYPTYSLTVTLMSLVAAGVGSVTSERWRDATAAAPWLGVAVVVLAAVYAVGLDAITPTVLPLPLAARVAVAMAATAPLGFVLGMFLPLGVRCITRKSDDPAPLVAWAWATNGFCSVIGSVATTMLAMTLGFRIVFGAAAATCLVAVWLLARLGR